MPSNQGAGGGQDKAQQKALNGWYHLSYTHTNAVNTVTVYGPNGEVRYTFDSNSPSYYVHTKAVGTITIGDRFDIHSFTITSRGKPNTQARWDARKEKRALQKIVGETGSGLKGGRL